MTKLLDPVEQRDFSKGRLNKDVVNPVLIPKNSAANAINVDFSEVIGSPIVRKGNKMTLKLMRFTTEGEFFFTNDTSTPIYDVNWYSQTFTPQTASQLLIEVQLKLKRVGTPAGNIIVQIQQTTAGNPNGTIVCSTEYDASTIATGAGGVYDIIFIPPTLVQGTVYAIVVKSPACVDSSNCIYWFKNAAGGYANGSARESTNSGSTWAAFSTNDFYFITQIQNSIANWDNPPLGNFAGQIGTTDVEILSMTSSESGKAVIYYWDAVAGEYKVSLLTTLSGSAKQRYAILSGRIYVANGVDNMMSSIDFGKTWVATVAGGNITTNSVIPSMLWVSKNRLLASGYSAFKSRVYFSSVVDPNGSPTITWNTDPTNGDWIDINPDDGGVVTGFANTSNLALVFKDSAMYRLNTINKTVDSENIFNIGAVNQESIISCLGVTYFYSANGIYRTDGGFPEMISRVGVQDFLGNVRDINRVYTGTDSLNVFFSLGVIIMNEGTQDERRFQYVELKFSPRDETWSIFTYSVRPAQHALFGDAPTQKLMVVQYNGDLGQIEFQAGGQNGNNDYDAAIPYEMESQELEMGNRSHTKIISNKIVVYTKDGGNGSLLLKSNDDDFDPIKMLLTGRVNVGNDINIAGEFFTYLWKGEALGMRPIFQGLYLPSVTDQGITK